MASLRDGFSPGFLSHQGMDISSLGYDPAFASSRSSVTCEFPATTIHHLVRIVACMGKFSEDIALICFSNRFDLMSFSSSSSVQMTSRLQPALFTRFETGAALPLDDDVSSLFYGGGPSPNSNWGSLVRVGGPGSSTFRHKRSGRIIVDHEPVTFLASLSAQTFQSIFHHRATRRVEKCKMRFDLSLSMCDVVFYCKTGIVKHYRFNWRDPFEVPTYKPSSEHGDALISAKFLDHCLADIPPATKLVALQFHVPTQSVAIQTVTPPHIATGTGSGASQRSFNPRGPSDNGGSSLMVNRGASSPRPVAMSSRLEFTVEDFHLLRPPCSCQVVFAFPEFRAFLTFIAGSYKYLRVRMHPSMSLHFETAHDGPQADVPQNSLVLAVDPNPEQYDIPWPGGAGAGGRTSEMSPPFGGGVPRVAQAADPFDLPAIAGSLSDPFVPRAPTTPAPSRPLVLQQPIVCPESDSEAGDGGSTDEAMGDPVDGGYLSGPLSIRDPDLSDWDFSSGSDSDF
ncbi:hypothetical protein H696_03201 [Fonticula alba]|uniref:Uncharacterized protein n=1 Tax=Fonticula alba TaxID=691883 RepID=A0A058Z956_FONAL|nr:hypothetical protein H696_03201 [Fonticula alba]KCV70844.1 hypothetical protein H696_03201 [Fonticula alba]|eukprot:XP_009495360.1 hypothetical protein H696_03201 [Fonticula alba]